MYTDMVSIKCPNCGGHIEREENEFFAKCPFCGMEVGFDELSEESQIGGLRSEIDTLRRNEKEDTNRRRKLSRWIRLRNIAIGAIAVLHLLGFVLIGIAIDVEPRRETPMTFGVVFVMLAWIGAVLAPVFLGLKYPDYNIITKKKERGGKFKAFIKILGINICLLVLSAFMAYAILRFTIGV